MFDNSKWEEVPYDTSFKDFLNWKDRISYKERVQKSIEATGQDEVGIIAKGEINGTKVCCISMNFLWAGGSVGHNFGECVIKGRNKQKKTYHSLFLLSLVEPNDGGSDITNATPTNDSCYTNI